MMLKDKTILLGVTGGIAAYKSAMLASRLVKTGACVHVIMTQNATNFINPITFETLTRNKCIVDTFDRNFESGTRCSCSKSRRHHGCSGNCKCNCKTCTRTG